MCEFFKPASDAPDGATIHRFFSDPGHGWLEVQVVELVALEIQNEISSFSYLSDGIAYLEEDCDLSVFLRACAAKQRTVYYTSVFQESTPIRHFDRYRVLL